VTQSTIQIPFPEPGPESPEEKNHNPYIVAAILALSIVVLLFYRLSGSQVVPQDSATTVGLSKKSSNHIVVDVDGAVVRPGVYRLRVGSRAFDAIASAGGLKPNADKIQVNMAKKLRDEEKLIVPEIGQVLPTPSETPEPGQDPGDISQELPPEEPVLEDPDPEPLPELTPAEEIPTPSAPQAVTPSPAPRIEKTPAASPTPVVERPTLPAAARISINRATADQLEGIPGLGPKLALDIVNYRKGPPPHAFTSLEELTQVPGLKQAKYEEILPYVKL
jgi:competence ComEA-like helix-hairpin-helix protein